MLTSTHQPPQIFVVYIAWRVYIRRLRWVLAAYALLGLALWPLPLLGLLHAESSAGVAGVAFFAAGLSSLRLFGGGGTFRRVLGAQEAALVVPWALLTVTLLWRPNCGYLMGLLFYALFPVVSAALAVAGAYALSGTAFRYKRTIFCAVGLAVVVLGPVYDLGLHPQFYTYNHVFGGVLGPIYDEELALRPGLFAFRGLTLLWAVFFFMTGRWLRVRGRRADTEDRGSRIEDGEKGRKRKTILYPPSSIFKSPTARRYLLGIAVVSAAIILCYLFSARLGFNTPAWYLQEELGGHLRTEHFDLYYDPEAVSEAELAYLAEDQEYRYAWLAGQLEMEGPARIAVYLYPSPEAKARLTGARLTSVAPVWLPEPQVHLLQQRYAAGFGHELVHVFSRAFGLPLINVSASVGLVEGLAVALEPPGGRPPPHGQVLAAALSDAPPRAELTLAEEVAARLSPLGFWTGRGAVSYTTMGSFVRFLIDRYGADPFKRAYAWGDLEEVYGQPVSALAAEWQQFLHGLPVMSSAAGPLAVRRFARLSLFEQRCPHYVPPYVEATREGVRALAEGDTARARRELAEALTEQAGYAPAQLARARLSLAQQRPQAALAMLRRLPEAHRTAEEAVLRGDARALLDEADRARVQYREAVDRLPLYAHSARAQVILRLALADRPAAGRILTGIAEPDAQARRLAALSGSSIALSIQRAVLLMAAEAYAPAAALLGRTASQSVDGLARPYHEAELQRVRPAWRARAAHRTGQLGDARRFARQVIEASAAAGALGEVAYWQDFIRKMRWIERQPAGRVRISHAGERVAPSARRSAPDGVATFCSHRMEP